MIPKYIVNYTSEARNDLNLIYENVLHKSGYFEYAKNTKESITKFIDSLNIAPKRYKEYNEGIWKNKGYRKGKVKNYIVFYKVDDEKNIVYIGRIYFSKQKYN